MKKATVFITVLIWGLLLTSCENMGDTTQSTERTASKITETSVSEEGIESTKDHEYASYLEKYGEPFAEIFYRQRETGSPDLLEKCILGDDSDIRMKPTKEQYSLADNDAQWGITVIDVSDNLSLKKFSEYLNIEKFDGETWVRQAIFDTGRYMQTPTGTVTPPSSEMLENRLVSAKWSVRVEHIYPAPTPGTYRFVFYASVEQNGKTENRIYYIPFEVVE